MAQRLTAICFCAIVPALSCQAQGLVDPTRPPNAQVLPGEGSGVEEEGAGPRLESVLLAPRRKLAVINGQTVQLGGRFGDAKVVAISETSVVLERSGSRETLQLLPSAARKTPVKAGTKAKERVVGQ